MPVDCKDGRDLSTCTCCSKPNGYEFALSTLASTSFPWGFKVSCSTPSRTPGQHRLCSWVPARLLVRGGTPSPTKQALNIKLCTMSRGLPPAISKPACV